MQDALSNPDDRMAKPKRYAEPAEEPKATRLKTTFTPEVSMIFSIESHPGALQDALAVFKVHNVDLKHIESRPSKTSKSAYDFFVTCVSATPKDFTDCTATLSKIAKITTILDNDPDTSNPTWFPRRIRELDIFASRVLGACEDLESDHPGFHDQAYRERRNYFAAIANKYKHGEPLPRVEYSPSEIETWGVIFRQLSKLYPTHACEEHNRVFPLLMENCGYGENSIPQLEDVSRFLHDCTGFRLRPVSGLLSSRDFLAGLAFRVFHSTQYLRHSSRPLYTPEPDVVHELLGHAPLFADKSFAEFSQEIGLASLGASDEDISKLATCYWFTVEFGLCRQHGKVKAYGAGLLSSFGELEYCLSDKPKLLDFEPAKTGVQEYPITEYQPVYFVAESFEDAKTKLREFASTLKKPFTVRYNAYTESIEVLDNADSLRDLAFSIKTDVAALAHALASHTSSS